ncbi:MAG: DUF3800 domain-containing protein, partial [Candidatus Solibacter sp.]
MIQELARLLHSEESVDRWMLMLRAYCDESGNHDDAPFFTMAGFLGRERAWKVLARKWNRALSKEGLEEFHMKDCEGGHNMFSHLHEQKYRPERDRIQKRFIEIILDSEIYPVAGGVDMQDYNRLLPRLRLIRKDPRYTKSPYYLAFEYFVMAVCRRAEFASNLEQIAFVFDRQQEFSKRAKELYDQAILLPRRRNLWVNLPGFSRTI